MSIRAMHNSSVIHPESDEWEATVSYMAVAETTQKILYFRSTTLSEKFSESGLNLKCLSALYVRAFYLVYINAKTFNLCCLYSHHN